MLVGGTAACSPALTGNDTAEHANSPDATSAAEPGRHRGLPEPCGAVTGDTLNQLLPDTSPEQLGGTPSVTYDTGRRVGCTWVGPHESGRHELAIDFERVISYDPDVSDDDQATRNFEDGQSEAGVPTTEPGGFPSDGTDGEKTEVPGGATPDDAPSSGAPGGGPSGVTSPDGELAPRTLPDLGNSAYLDDQLNTTHSEARRDITLAFRTGNVIVTVHYAETSSEPTEAPDSARLQDGASSLARQLVGRFEG